MKPGTPDDALDDVADVALEAEEQEEESVLLEQDVSLEQKPTGGGYYVVPAQQPAPVMQSQPAPVDEREFWAVRAIVAIGLFILSIGLMCAAGPAVMAIISLIFLSVIVLF